MTLIRDSVGQVLTVLLALTVSVVMPRDDADATAPAPRFADIAAVDRYVEQQVAKHGAPGLALAVTRDDEVLLVKGYGVAGERPVTAQTQFLLGSVSKSFTAVAVMQLVEAGRVALDEPVTTYLPEFTVATAGGAVQITVRSLLHQTSGLADAGFPAYTLPQPETIAERVQSLRSAELVSTPGTEFHYTDLNYAVLARLVEVVSGRPFAEILQDHLFTPLDMTNTSAVSTTAEARRAAPHLAQGHIQLFGMPIERDELDGYLGGSSGVISTAEDLAGYLIAHNTGGSFNGAQVLSPASVAALHRPPPDVDSSYAMGWVLDDDPDGSTVVQHSGVLSTYHADIALLPQHDYGIALLYNYNHALANYAGIRNGIVALLLGEQPAGTGPGAAGTGLILAGLIVVTSALLYLALRRVPAWARKRRGRPWWRILPGIAWTLLPALLVLALPKLIQLFADRVFTHYQILLAMPDVLVWLGITAVFSLLVGVARLLRLTRGRRRPGLDM